MPFESARLAPLKPSKLRVRLPLPKSRVVFLVGGATRRPDVRLRTSVEMGSVTFDETCDFACVPMARCWASQYARSRRSTVGVDVIPLPVGTSMMSASCGPLDTVAKRSLMMFRPRPMPCALAFVGDSARANAATTMLKTARIRGRGSGLWKFIIGVHTPHGAVDGKTRATRSDFTESGRCYT